MELRANAKRLISALLAFVLVLSWVPGSGLTARAAETPPETTAETTVPETTAETTVPETTAEATVPETTVPETTVPETTVPETTVPETTVPETTVPETTVPETTAPETTPVQQVQARIDTLPEHITEENREDVTARLQEILALYAALDEAEQEQVDITPCILLQQELDAASVPELLANNLDVSVGDVVISANGDYTITGTTTTNTITVESGINANITLNNVNINVSAMDKTAAFKIADNSGGNVTVTLVGTNILRSGAGCAGLQKNGASVGTLTITGSGSLTAMGGGSKYQPQVQYPLAGAGIGGGNGQVASNITISGGTVTAYGATGLSYSNSSSGAAGIGGGNKRGDNTNIQITGGVVNAIGGDKAAGIGGGMYGSSSITISGGTIDATGGDAGAGIGGGNEGNGTVTINGGTVTATGGVGGAGIGGGMGVPALSVQGNVTISGGTVNATGGENANGIGGGLSGSGSLSTGSGGTAWINASSISGGSGWSGVIFNGSGGQIYGNSYTLSQDAEIPSGKTLTVPSDKALTIGAGATLTNSGTLTLDGGTLTGWDGCLSGSGQFQTTQLTEAMITVPTDLVYSGQDPIETIKQNTKAAKTYCGQEFQVTGWTQNVTKTDDLHYTVTYTKDSQTISKSVTLAQSGTTLSAELLGGKDHYFSTETITINATVTATGAAPVSLNSLTAPTEGQLAVYEGDTQVSEAKTPDENGACSFDIPAKTLGAGTHTLVVKYTASAVMAGAESTSLTVTVTECLHENVINGQCTVCGAIMVASVKVEGQRATYYTDFAKAWKSADGKTAEIILLANASVDSWLTAKASSSDYNPTNITLKAQGNATLTSTNQHNALFYIENGGTVTFCNGNYKANEKGKACINVSGGTAIIKDGTYTGGTTSALKVEGGTVRLSGGTFSTGAWSSGAIKISEYSEPKQTLNDLLANDERKTYAYKTADSSGTGWVSGDALNGTATPEKTTVTVVKAPVQSITQPTSPEAVVYGYTDAPTLSVTATPATTGNAITYQWYRVKEGTEAADAALVGQTINTLPVPIGLDAGEHKFYCAVTCDGYTVNSNPATVTVKPAPLPEVTWGPERVTYNGGAQKPTVTVGSLTEGTDYEVIYTRSDAVTNDFTNAGEIKITVTGTGNYEGMEEMTYTIAQAPLTITANAQTITYGGSITQGTGQVTATGLASGDALESVTLTPNSDQVAVENKTITPSAATVKKGNTDVTANYVITYQAGSLTINKSAPMIAFANGYDPSKTYDGQTIANPTEGDLIITGAAFEDVVFSWSATPLNAGTYTLTASIADTANTQAASASQNMTISPKPVTPTVTVDPADIVYDGTAKTPGVTVMDGDTAIPGTQYTATYSDNIDAGTATVNITAKADGNYSFTPVSANFPIARRTAQLVWSGTQLTYNGTSQAPTATVGNLVSGDSCTVTVDGAQTYAGKDYTVRATALSNDNYKLPDNAATAFAIAPKPITVTITPNGGVYGGEIKAATAELNDVITGDTVPVALTYTGTANDGTKVNSETHPTLAGTYTVTASIPEGSYILTGEASAQFQVSRAECLLKAEPAEGSKTYGDEDFTLTVTHEGPGAVAYASGDESVVTVDETGKVHIVGAGTAKITVTVAETASYAAATEEVTVTVNKKPVKVTVDSKTKIYGEPDPELTYTVEKDALVGSDTLKIELTISGEDVGTYDITDPNAAKNNPNYEITFEKGQLTIDPRTIDDAEIVLGPVLTASGREQTQTVKSVTVKNSKGEVLNVTYDVTGNTATKAGGYEMTITGTGNFTGTKKQPFAIAPGAGQSVDTDSSGNPVLGDGTVIEEVRRESGAPATSLGTPKAEIMEILTQSGDVTAQELAAVAEGADLKIIFPVKDGVSADDQAKIKALARGYTVGSYFDITMYKQLGDGERTYLHETGKPITMTVRVPDRLLNTQRNVKRTFWIVRCHDGNAQFLPTRYNDSDKTLSFETDRFSGYAIVYKDTKASGNPQNTATNDIPRTGDTSHIALWITVMALSAVGIGAVMTVKRKKKK